MACERRVARNPAKFGAHLELPSEDLPPVAPGVGHGALLGRRRRASGDAAKILNERAVFEKRGRVHLSACAASLLSGSAEELSISRYERSNG